MSAEEAARFCPSCGRENADSHRFCPSCGTLLVLEAAQPKAPEPSKAPEEEEKAPVLDEKRAALSPEAKNDELQRLLTRANVERMRALLVPAKKTLEEALPLAIAIGPLAIAQVQEQRGDLLAMEERWREAQGCYAEARKADPARAVIEKKYAEMAVRLADEAAMARLGDVMLRGDSLGEILTEPRQGKRNAFAAMLASALVPGLGQILAGQLIKGGIVMGVWLLCLAWIGLGPDRESFTATLTGMINPAAARGLPKQVGSLTWLAAVGIVVTWLYSVFEAPLSAGKTQPLRTTGGEFVDKSGWEP
jgi:hypothetical protein